MGIKIILNKDVPPLGRAGDIKEVSLGYARNFLLPRNLAKIATPPAIAQAEKIQVQQQKEREETVAKLRQEAEKLKKIVLEIKLKTGKRGEVFENLNKGDVAEILKDKGITIDPGHIEFKPTKKPGNYEATIKLGEGIATKLKITVTK